MKEMTENEDATGDDVVQNVEAAQNVDVDRRPATASLTVDYSNGIVTTAGRVLLDAEGGLWATLALGSTERKQLVVAVAEGLVDRGGNHRTHIVSIDGVAIEPARTSWSIWVNGQSAGNEIYYHQPGLPGSGRAQPVVNDGDHVLIKLVSIESDS